MSDLVNELRQYALMCANELKKLNPEKHDEIENAYARVKTFTGNICPMCWVNNEKAFSLEIEAKASEANYYRCKQCEFGGIFPKK